jgi:multidrug transporter EmrE-like cation transporter
MNNQIKVVIVALILIANGVMAAFMAKSIRAGNMAWYWTYLTSFISASIFAYQLRAKMLPLTLMSAFQTFFFHAAWYTTAYFILNNELHGHKMIGLILVFVGMITMSL